MHRPLSPDNNKYIYIRIFTVLVGEHKICIGLFHLTTTTSATYTSGSSQYLLASTRHASASFTCQQQVLHIHQDLHSTCWREQDMHRPLSPDNNKYIYIRIFTVLVGEYKTSIGLFHLTTTSATYTSGSSQYLLASTRHASASFT